MELDVAQQTAIDLCVDLNNRLVAVSGEAGTGKTTIIRTVCDILTEKGISFALAAPTGKAARRIREATGYPAVTIHKLLEFNRPEIDETTGNPKDSTLPGRHAGNPLDEKVVLIDEYAMVSTALHRDLAAAIGQGCMRVFGDVRQLPPIDNARLADPTSPFEKCLKMRNAVILNRVYRQEEGNGILEAARAINAGAPFSRNGDVNLIFSATMVGKLRDDVAADPDKWRSTRCQVISPLRKNDIGTVRLNGLLQSVLLGDMSEKIELPRHKWQEKEHVYVGVGDKVVCTTNVYDMRDYTERFSNWLDDITPDRMSFIPCPETKTMLNGEVGIVYAVHPDGAIEIDFGDRVVEVPTTVLEYSEKHRMLIRVDNRKNIELAYALTTHKCQGSEYDEVAYIMAASAFFVLNRPNFYTAITRAKKKATIYTDQRAFMTALKNRTAFRPGEKK